MDGRPCLAWNALFMIESLFFWMLLLLGASAESIFSCPKYQFPCESSDNQCVPSHLWCNDVNDCRNGMDENPGCESKLQMYKQDTSKMSRCNKVVMELKNRTMRRNSPSYDQGNVDDICEFKRLPWNAKFRCDCDPNFIASSLSVYCEADSNFSKPPYLGYVQPHPTTITIFSRRGMTGCLGGSSYRIMPGLLSLSYAGNNIKCLTERAFGKMILSSLKLTNNSLTTLLPNTFDGLNVCWLYLDHNSLTDFSADVFSLDNHIQWVSLYRNNLTLERPGMLDNLPYTVVLELGHNQIRRIRNDTFSNNRQLSTLDLTDNRIEAIDRGAFDNLLDLTTLNLTNNNLRNISGGLIAKNIYLREFSLAFNPLTDLPPEIFQNFVNCSALDLRGIIIDNVDENMFQSLPSSCVVMFEKLYYCFAAHHIRNCTPKSDGLSSFDHLLVNPLLVTLSWTLAVFTVLCNLAVFCVRWYLDRTLNSGLHNMVVRDARIISLFVKNLSFSDFLTGIYLLGVCYHNEKFKGRYSKFAIDWVYSDKCKALGIIAMSSAEISMMILTFIAVDRFVTIVCGIHRPKFSVAAVRAILVLIWITGFTVAIVPAFLWGDRTNNYYGNNGVCLPLYLHEPHLKGWIYSLMVLIGLNGFLILLIIISYMGIFITIRSFRKGSVSMTTVAADEIELFWRFFILVSLNLCCWAPTFILKFLALTNYKVPNDSYAWIVAFVFPLNSAMNPIVYSLSSSEFRSRVAHATGCHQVLHLFLQRLHVLGRRLSSPFSATSCTPPWPTQNDVVSPRDLYAQGDTERLPGANSLCKRLRDKCRSAITTPRSSRSPEHSQQAPAAPYRATRYRHSDLLDVPHAQHELIPLNSFVKADLQLSHKPAS